MWGGGAQPWGLELVQSLDLIISEMSFVLISEMSFVLSCDAINMFSRWSLLMVSRDHP